MEKSMVYFTDFRCPVGTSQLEKLKKLCVAAGIKEEHTEVRLNGTLLKKEADFWIDTAFSKWYVSTYSRKQKSMR